MPSSFISLLCGQTSSLFSTTFAETVNGRLSDGLIVREQLSHLISPLASLSRVALFQTEAPLSTGKGRRSLQYLSAAPM